MKRIAAWSAVLGAVSGLLAVGAVLFKGEIDKHVRVLFSPIAFGIGGYVAGVAIFCLFAPRAFLTSPIGRPWMKWVGTNSATVMRIMCAMIALFGIAAITIGPILVFLASG